MSNIIRSYSSSFVSQRPDGYLNATDMCKALNKSWSNYIRLDSSKAYYDELSSVLHISRTDLIITKAGGIPTEQGTWIHPKAAIHLAQWLSPAFAVQVTEWVFELMTQGYVSMAQAHHTRTGKVLLWDAFESEDCLSEMIHSFVVGVCGHRHLEKEVPYVDKSQDKHRRLDFVERYSRVVYGYELKLGKITAADIVVTVGQKAYCEVLNKAIEDIDKVNNRKPRPVKFILMSPEGITEEASKLLDQMPNVSYMSVSEYCYKWFKKAWYVKYQNQSKELANKIIIKYNQLFTTQTVNKLRKFA